jgi:hypothetical protein
MPLAFGMRWVTRRSVADKSGIPSLPWSLRLAAKAALDDVFLASELVSATVVSLNSRERILREMSDAEKLFESRGWLEDPVVYHRHPPPLERISLNERSSTHGRYEHLSYESGYAPDRAEPGRSRWLGYQGNRTAHAWLFQHPGEPRPWLVCVPGYRMGHPLIDFMGFKASWLHRELGLNVAIPVLPFHGPRSIGRRGGDGFFSGDFMDTVHAQAQSVWDIRRLIEWLRAEGAPLIGVHGVSLGGYTSALLAGIQDDLDCVIVGIPATDFVSLIRSHLPRPLLSFAERAHFPFETIESLLRVVSPLAIPRRTPRDRCFLYAAKSDRLTLPSQAQKLWRHWQHPKLGWYEGGHVSFLWDETVRVLVREGLETCGLIDAARVSSCASGLEVISQ